MCSRSLLRSVRAPLSVLWIGLALAACQRGSEPAASEPPRGTGIAPLRAVGVPVGAESYEPRLAAGRDGTLLLSWLEPVGDEFDNQLMYSRWTGSEWSTPFVAARGADWFVNAADTPVVHG